MSLFLWHFPHFPEVFHHTCIPKWRFCGYKLTLSPPEPRCVGPVGPGKLEWDDLIEAFDKYEQSNEISEDVKCQIAKVPTENTIIFYDFFLEILRKMGGELTINTTQTWITWMADLLLSDFWRVAVEFDKCRATIELLGMHMCFFMQWGS